MATWDLGGSFVGGFRAGTDAAAQRIVNSIRMAEERRNVEKQRIDMRDREWAFEQTLSAKEKADRMQEYMGMIYSSNMTEGKTTGELALMLNALSNMDRDQFQSWFASQRRQVGQVAADATDVSNRVAPGTTAGEVATRTTEENAARVEAASTGVTPELPPLGQPQVPATAPTLNRPTVSSPQPQVRVPSYSEGGTRPAPTVAPTPTGQAPVTINISSTPLPPSNAPRLASSSGAANPYAAQSYVPTTMNNTDYVQYYDRAGNRQPPPQGAQ